MGAIMVEEKKDFQILSLCGGGIRGLYTISVLATLEELLAEKTNNPDYWIGQHFDLISGTSIGGILALGLANGVTARELLHILDKKRKIIFPNRLGYWLFFKQLFTSRREHTPLRLSLEEIFAHKTLQDLKVPVIIPAVNYTTGQPKMFKTPHDDSFIFDKNISLVNVALATSAAPTYFPAFEIKNNLYVDGGLIANSPCLIGWHEAINVFQRKANEPFRIKILNIGTMAGNVVSNHKKNKMENIKSMGVFEPVAGRRTPFRTDSFG
ncbi:hypothetical protein B7R74_21550 [Yersinia pseudotuberculosis]|nr:hypothetical protein B7R74_21550 [Yersinia pseudotuberculosis]